MTKLKKPELLAPVGNFEMLAVALKEFPDAIYFGIKGVNMRANAKNFTANDIKKITKACHGKNIKCYLTLNTIVFEEELKKIKKIIDIAKNSDIDAIICWDMSIINYAKKKGIKTHLSTQASVSNSDSIKFYKKLGVTKIVLARESTLKEIIEIKKNLEKNKINIEIETFVHGAMCVGVSGRCFMSENLYGKSANRGECIQPCRRKYKITDPETNKELELDNHYIMSPKDMCTIEIIDKLINAGIDSFKIEGRNRSPEYLQTTIQVYKEAINSHFNKTLTKEKKRKLIKKLKEVYNRDFSTGFYMSRPIKEWTNAYGSKATKKKIYIGKITNFYKELNVAEVKLEAGDLKKGEEILIQGPTTGSIKQIINSIQIEKKEIDIGKQGKSVAIKTNKLVRKNDKVYLWVKSKDKA